MLSISKKAKFFHEVSVIQISVVSSFRKELDKSAARRGNNAECLKNAKHFQETKLFHGALISQEMAQVPHF